MLMAPGGAGRADYFLNIRLTFHVLAMVGYLKKVNPIFAQMRNRITNVEFTIVCLSITKMLCIVFLVCLLLFKVINIRFNFVYN